jgi:hypothetical protein
LKTLLAALLLSCSVTALGQGSEGIQARNVVAISEQLVTAGQPTAESLAGLAKLGFQAVVNLAPPAVSGAVAGEAEIVRGQAMEFINIPVDWNKPTEADFQSFAATMQNLRGTRVLVPGEHARLSDDLSVPGDFAEREPRAGL